MSEFGRVTVTTKLDQLSQIITNFQSDSTMTGQAIEPATSSTENADYTTAQPLLKVGFFLFLMDIIVWKKVKNTKKSLSSPFINVDIQQCCSQVFMLHFFFFIFFCYNIDKRGKGDILILFNFNFCHVLSTYVHDCSRKVGWDILLNWIFRGALCRLFPQRIHTTNFDQLILDYDCISVKVTREILRT